jgi:hypothetical protein
MRLPVLRAGSQLPPDPGHARKQRSRVVVPSRGHGAGTRGGDRRVRRRVQVPPLASWRTRRACRCRDRPTRKRVLVVDFARRTQRSRPAQRCGSRSHLAQGPIARRPPPGMAGRDRQQRDRRGSRHPARQRLDATPAASWRRQHRAEGQGFEPWVRGCLRWPSGPAGTLGTVVETDDKTCWSRSATIAATRSTSSACPMTPVATQRADGSRAAS